MSPLSLQSQEVKGCLLVVAAKSGLPDIKNGAPDMWRLPSGKQWHSSEEEVECEVAPTSWSEAET